jgi:hypothetical protein
MLRVCRLFLLKRIFEITPEKLQDTKKVDAAILEEDEAIATN